MSTQELAKELPYSDTYGAEPWDAPAERAKSIHKAIERDIRKQDPEHSRKVSEAKKKAQSKAKKELKSLGKQLLDWKTWKTP